MLSRIDVITSTLGKALGGASGGFTTGKKEIVDLLRQRSRPYLFSNSLAPSIVGATLAAFALIEEHPELRERVMQNARSFRGRMQEWVNSLWADKDALLDELRQSAPPAR